MTREISMVLAGGVGLGAYQFGAYGAMEEQIRNRIGWLAGSSIGAVNAALIAGNPPERRLEALAAFWDDAATQAGLVPAPNELGAWRQGFSWLSVAHSRVFGRTGLFRPLPWSAIIAANGVALYDLAPLARKLQRLVDFDRLNSGEIRLSVVTTDLRTGNAVIFDTGSGDVIRPEHILASCGLIPEFEPTEIDGRLLGDGGLVANAPLEVVLGNRAGDEDLVCFVLDLFSTDAGPPASLEHAAELRLDFFMASPTHRALEALRREHALRRLLAVTAEALPSGTQEQNARSGALDAARRGSTTVVHLSHRSAPGEAGPEKQFDFSRGSLSARREAGAADMAKAMQLLADEQAGEGSGGFTVHRVRR